MHDFKKENRNLKVIELFAKKCNALYCNYKVKSSGKLQGAKYACLSLYKSV